MGGLWILTASRLTAILSTKEKLMSKCLCGAYDCGACYPATYRKYIAQENGEIEEGEEYQEPEEDEDIARSERSGRER